MTKFFVGATVSMLLTAPVAFAGPGQGNTGNGNSDLAQSMAAAVSGGGATLGRDLGGKGRGTASVVSGGGTGGWGNEGSASAVGLADGQVSNRGGDRGR